ncbi:hypothetical protein E0485_18660 [Paenibacillus albiflavus]|uniref:SPOR domain-containing protein n=1 Tax=Paenibacillus albiflavus TaxID=2545760 RepID=A0A4R4EB75_9BACL|nr:hypothetical protein [Paenibacillus albiflavus]TCZ75168.1 hypothetical protein E0485_18660 [Paenibacillus albiflavus]
MNKNKISIQFDHRGRRVQGVDRQTIGTNKVLPFRQHEAKQDEAKPLPEVSTEFSPWQHGTEEDEVIGDKEEQLELDRAQHSAPTESIWELNRDQIWVDDVFQGVMLRKRPPTSWWKSILLIGAAIVTGATLGLFIMNLLNPGEGQRLDAAQPNLGTTIVSSTSPSSSPASQVAGTDEAVRPVISGMQGIHIVKAQINAFSYQLLQHGVFNSQSVGQSAIDGLKRQGYTAAVEQGEKMIVYAAFASNKSEAQRLSALLKEKKIDIYVKSVEMPGLTQINWSGAKPENVSDYLVNGDKLLRMMNGVAVAHLEEAQITPFEPVTMKAIQEAYASWTAALNAISDGGDAANKSILAMNESMKAAVQAFEAYEKKPSASALWQAQAAMMKYVIEQKQLYSVIAPI